MPSSLIFGGTFDPVHLGHLQVCHEASKLLQVDIVRLLPSAVPPHRNRPKASAEQRLQMLEIAICEFAKQIPGSSPDQNTKWLTDPRELQRLGPSYTIDTLKELRAELGPEHVLYLLIGADQLQKLHTWHCWQQLFDYTHVAVMTRPDTQAPAAEVTAFIDARRCSSTEPCAQPSGCYMELIVTSLTISATQIRHALAYNRNQIMGLDPAVLRYIQQHGLYLPC